MRAACGERWLAQRRVSMGLVCLFEQPTRASASPGTLSITHDDTPRRVELGGVFCRPCELWYNVNHVSCTYTNILACPQKQQCSKLDGRKMWREDCGFVKSAFTWVRSQSPSSHTSGPIGILSKSNLSLARFYQTHIRSFVITNLQPVQPLPKSRCQRPSIAFTMTRFMRFSTSERPSRVRELINLPVLRIYQASRTSRSTIVIGQGPLYLSVRPT